MLSDNSARLIIICGLPGSGKTTLAKQLEGTCQAVRLCPDEWMGTLKLDIYDEGKRAQIEALQWEIAQKLLTLGNTVIIEWGTWAKSERDILRLRARALDASVELHYLSAPIDVLYDRIQSRGMENPPIERKMLEKWFKVFQAPTPEELSHFDAPL